MSEPQSAQGTAHTPGPWRIERLKPTLISITGHYQVCQIDFYAEDTAECEANAALIAQAPETAKQRDELLVMLKDCHEYISRNEMSEEPFLVKLRAAIARAEGRAET